MNVKLTKKQEALTALLDENKRQITLRIDGDVLAFFKTTGRRYCVLT